MAFLTCRHGAVSLGEFNANAPDRCRIEIHFVVRVIVVLGSLRIPRAHDRHGRAHDLRAVRFLDLNPPPGVGGKRIRRHGVNVVVVVRRRVLADTDHRHGAVLSADPGADDRGAVVLVRKLHDEVTLCARLDSTVSLGELDAHAADRRRIKIDFVVRVIVSGGIVRVVVVRVGVTTSIVAGRHVCLVAVSTAADEDQQRHRRDD